MDLQFSQSRRFHGEVVDTLATWQHQHEEKSSGVSAQARDASIALTRRTAGLAATDGHRAAVAMRGATGGPARRLDAHSATPRGAP